MKRRRTIQTGIIIASLGVDRLIETFTAKIMQSSKSGEWGAQKDNLQIDLKSYFLRGMAFVKKRSAVLLPTSPQS